MAPRDRTSVPFASAQGMVGAIWADMDLRHPPAVEQLPRHARTTLASANRLSLFLPDQLPGWCLLHELAHAMSTTIDGRSDGHGPIFMGLYVRMLVRYLRLDEASLLTSLREASIAIALDARPVFVDPSPPGASQTAPAACSD